MNRARSTRIDAAPNRLLSRSLSAVIIGAMLAAAGGCGDMLQRRVELPETSGADPELEDRFGLTDDAQDPTQRDKELGYGRWRAAPETEGTKDQFSPSRRKDNTPN